MLLWQVNIDSLLKPPPDGRVQNPWYVGGSQHQNTVKNVIPSYIRVSVVLISVAHNFHGMTDGPSLSFHESSFHTMKDEAVFVFHTMKAGSWDLI